MLDLQIPDAPVQAQKAAQSIEGGQHGVDGDRHISGGEQMRFPLRRQLFCEAPLLQPERKGPQVPQIFFYRAGGVFLCP